VKTDYAGQKQASGEVSLWSVEHPDIAVRDSVGKISCRFMRSTTMEKKKGGECGRRWPRWRTPPPELQMCDLFLTKSRRRLAAPRMCRSKISGGLNNVPETRLIFGINIRFVTDNFKGSISEVHALFERIPGAPELERNGCAGSPFWTADLLLATRADRDFPPRSVAQC